MLYRLLLLFLSLLCVCGCETIKFAPQTATKKIPPSFDVKNKNFALVLGGGGAKGFAHIGVLEELHNAGLTPDIIIGCSAGSIVGALYAADPNIESLKARTLHQTRKEITSVDANIWPYGIYGSKQLSQYLADNLPEHSFDKLKIPLIVTATDLQYGELTTFSSGDLIASIIASASYPGLFAPKEVDGQFFIDCGVADPLPTRIAKELGFKNIIAVNISEELPNTPPNHALGVLKRSMEIGYKNLIKRSSEHATLMLNFNMSGVELFDDSRNVYIYEQGRMMARSKMSDIIKILDNSLNTN